MTTVSSRADAAARPASPASIPRVLLVEDNPMTVRLVTRLFGAHGGGRFHLDAVSSLGEALFFLASHAVDVVLLDLFLGDASGLEGLERVQEAHPLLAVVVMTSAGDERLAVEAIQAGAQDYLVKGEVDPPGVFRSIRYALERSQAEARNRMLEQRLLEARKLEAIATLAAGVAHNVNNTLMVVLGQTNFMLDQTPNSDPRKRRLRSIERAATRSVDLVRQLLTFSRVQSFNPVEVDLNGLLLSLEPALSAALGRRVEVRFVTGPSVPPLQADRRQLEQMLVSLALNARDAMPEGGTFAVRTSVSRDGARVMLEVADTGVGMSEEVRARAFEPFFTTRGLASASGLGLSAVAGIVRQHGGTIDVASREGAGTTFSIGLPVRSQAVQRDHRGAPEPDRVPGSAGRL